jgi:hypothetical protein
MFCVIGHRFDRQGNGTRLRGKGVHMLGRRRKPTSFVPNQQDFEDARTALTTNKSSGRVNVGRGARMPYPVRGESNYQAALASLKAYTDSRSRIPALLVREPDNKYDPNAVAVMIYGRLVGYLSRGDAADLTDTLDELADDGQFLACPARLTGGTRDKPNHGVVVEIREPSERFLSYAASCR